MFSISRTFALYSFVTVVMLVALPAANASVLQEVQGSTATIDQVFYSDHETSVRCDDYDASGARCTAQLTLTVQPMKGSSNVGEAFSIGSAAVDLAPGEQAALRFDHAADAYFDKVLARGHNGMVTLTYVDPTATTMTVAQWMDFSRLNPIPCAVPTLLSYQADQPVAHTVPVTAPGGSTRRETIVSPIRQLMGGYDITAKTATTVVMNGLTYTFAAGSSFNLTCSGVFVVNGGRLFASPMLMTGSVRVVGKPVGGTRQPAATVFTAEGSLGTRSAERVDLTVTRNARSRISTLKVKRGATAQITPKKSKKSSHCTNGSSLRVDRLGRISRV